ncbi:MAG: TldE/PmbA family protein [Planctomycetes bacterium]|nr:TldE/PmbA family protein [Planctomycetota bacterium]
MSVQTYFNELADHVTSLVSDEEVANLSFAAEDSDFVRFNQSKVRQAGSVQQRELGLDLIKGSKHCSGSLTLAGDSEQDRARVAKLVTDLRERRDLLPDDPHLLYATEPNSSELIKTGSLPSGGDAIGQIQEAGQDRDLVGIYAAGSIYSGFANTFGQRNWHQSENYNLDWSYYHGGDKATKSSYAGFEWDPAGLASKAERAASQLEALARPARKVERGDYRVYLTPAALREIMGMLSWGGFGLKSHKTKESPLIQMVEGDARLASSVTIRELTGEGIAPNFQEQGFLRPDAVTLIEGGAYKDCLISPRSAKEYGVETNGATAWESPESIDMAGGSLVEADVLKEIGTGIYVSNLWYLNWSDRSSCRTTGMTRFATFWVEGGEIVAPLNVMRFDETAYRVLGSNLVGLTAEREMILDAGSYGRRETSSARLPGALVNDFKFTL